jgi:hypothetical protein
MLTHTNTYRELTLKYILFLLIITLSANLTVYADNPSGIGAIKSNSTAVMANRLQVWNNTFQRQMDQVVADIALGNATANKDIFTSDGNEIWRFRTRTRPNNTSGDLELFVIARQNIGPLDGEDPNTSTFRIKPFQADGLGIPANGDNDPATPDSPAVVATWTCTVDLVQSSVLPYSLPNADNEKRRLRTIFVNAGGAFSNCTVL